MKLHNFWVKFLSVAILISLYLLLSHLLSTFFLPSPVKILSELYTILLNGKFAIHAMFTLKRVFISLFLSFFLTISIGTALGLNKKVSAFFELPLTLVLIIPTFVWIIVMLIFFGIRDVTLVAATSLTVAPLLIISYVEGVKDLDSSLLKVGIVFRFSNLKVLSSIILPQLLPYILGILRTGFTLSWKIALLAETFGISNGVGHQINLAFYSFLPQRIFAWILGFAGIALLIDKLFLQPLERRLTFWRTS